MSVTSSIRQGGVGMIEVLVALLIFTLGVLGMASMQVNAKRTGYDALQRSLATSLTRDIIERMRSNPSNASLTTYATVNNLGGGSKGDIEPAANCRSATCTPAQLATHDIWEWEQALDGAAETLNNVKAGGLVSPRACITNNAGLIEVVIAWRGYGGQLNPSNNTCGEGLGLYGTNEEERQLIIVTTFIEELE